MTYPGAVMPTQLHRRIALVLAVVLAVQGLLSGLTHQHCHDGCAIDPVPHAHAHDAACRSQTDHSAAIPDQHSAPARESQPSHSDDECIACQYLAARALSNAQVVELVWSEAHEPIEIAPPPLVVSDHRSLLHCRAPPVPVS
jgi:hypothetical protein